MGDYEREQERLQKLWDEVLSGDEHNFSPDVSDYEPSDSESSDSDDPVTPKKRTRLRSFDKTCQQVTKVIKFDQQVNVSSKSEIQSNNQDPQPSTSGCINTASTNIDHIIESVIAQHMDYIDDESEPSPIINFEWGQVTGNFLKNIPVTINDSGIKATVYEQYEQTPYFFYKMMITDEIIQLFVRETNIYAHQQKAKNTSQHSRVQTWKDTTENEMEAFLGCLMWMGLVQLPSLSAYWSKKSLYQNSLKHVLSRNRFQVLLKMWHFTNNEQANMDDRLHKIGPLLSKLQETFQASIVPGEYIVIDETLVPFKGKLKFKQYISNKRFKFGIKLFKLCLEGGYLYDLKVYCGREKEVSEEHSVPSQVVLNLTRDLLNSGRTIVVDNYYTSVELAHKLLENNTHIIGTLRSNRKLNPKTVLQAKLKRGEIIAEESNTGIFVEKWKDKRDVLMLNTKFLPEMVVVNRRSGELLKPKSVLEYNKHKAYIDLSGNFII